MNWWRHSALFNQREESTLITRFRTVLQTGMAVIYVFDLPYSVRTSLATILDSTGGWKELGIHGFFSVESILW